MGAIWTSSDDDLIAGIVRGGIYYSRDMGTTWHPSNKWTGTVRDIAGSQAQPDFLVAVIDHQGVMISEDRGKNWEWVGENIFTGNELAAAISGSKPLVIYVSTWNGEVYKSSDNGQTWTMADEVLNTSIVDLSVAPNSPDVVYAGTYNGIFITINGGKTWQAGTIANFDHQDNDCSK